MSLSDLTALNILSWSSPHDSPEATKELELKVLAYSSEEKEQAEGLLHLVEEVLKGEGVISCHFSNPMPYELWRPAW